jgi:hypothetical protein
MTGFVRPPHTDSKNEERREWLRIEDRLLLEYRRFDEPAEAMNAHLPPATEDTIATAVSKPTIDLLVRAGETFAGSPLLPWVSKIDWMLETILKSLVKSHPGSVAIARLTDVDISAGGLGFDTPRQFQAEDLLVLKVILPSIQHDRGHGAHHPGDSGREGLDGLSCRHTVYGVGRGRAGADYPAYSAGASRTSAGEKIRALTRPIHEYLLRRPILSPGEAVLVRPPRAHRLALKYAVPSTNCRPYVRAASAGFRLERLATAFINNPANLSERGSPRGTWIRRMLRPMRPVQVREWFRPESFPGEPGE